MAEIGDGLSCIRTNWIDSMVSCLLAFFISVFVFEGKNIARLNVCRFSRRFDSVPASVLHVEHGIASYTLISHSNSLPWLAVRSEVKRMHSLPIYW